MVKKIVTLRAQLQEKAGRSTTLRQAADAQSVAVKAAPIPGAQEL